MENNTTQNVQLQEIQTAILNKAYSVFSILAVVFGATGFICTSWVFGALGIVFSIIYTQQNGIGRQ